MEADSTTPPEEDINIEVLDVSDSDEECHDVEGWEDILLADPDDEVQIPASPSPSTSSSSSSIEVLDWPEAVNGDLDIEEAPRPSSPSESEAETVEMEDPRIPTPPPWNPPPPERDGPGGIPGPPEEVEVRLEEDPFWDPIRPFIPSLVWLEQYRPGLFRAIHEMVARYSHRDNEECPIRWRTDLAGRSALPTEIQEWPLEEPTMVDQETQTEFVAVERSTQTTPLTPAPTAPPSPAPPSPASPATTSPEAVKVPPASMDLDPVSSASEDTPETVDPFGPFPKPKVRPEKPQWWSSHSEESLYHERFYRRPNRRSRSRDGRLHPTPGTSRSRPEEPTCFVRWIDDSSEDEAPETPLYPAPNEPPRPQRLCWNCHKEGHNFSNCAETRRKFCQMCGRHGHTTRTCPRCRENWEAMGPYVPKYGTNVPRDYDHHRHRPY
ncbi:proteoglycan 4-like [Leptopilina boulardi]|uniref:proteoglycan 4-like n=1 Tax=Leptopilina boulardi TaxID=63433 RepID=UPI0021F5F1E3|nr:proteoglycan 4-like [Leptopilina boulardi]